MRGKMKCSHWDDELFPPSLHFLDFCKQISSHGTFRAIILKFYHLKSRSKPVTTL